LRQLSAVSSLPDFQLVMMLAAQRNGKQQTPQPRRLGPRRDAQSPDDAPVFEPVGNWLSGCTHPPGGDQSLGRTRQGPEVALDRLWSCGLARRDQVVRRRHATLGCWFLVGANPVSDSGRVACPRFTTAQAAFLAGPWGGTKWNFILEEAGKLVALAIKAGSQVTTDDLIGFRAFRDAVKRKASLVRGVVFA
jgi:hypothetical protein